MTPRGESARACLESRGRGSGWSRLGAAGAGEGAARRVGGDGGLLGVAVSVSSAVSTRRRRKQPVSIIYIFLSDTVISALPNVIA